MLQTITLQPMYGSKLILGADVLSNCVVLSDLPNHEHVTLSLTKAQHSDEASRALLETAERRLPNVSDLDRSIWEHADPNHTSADGRTPLILVTRAGNLEAVKLLCDAGAIKDQARDDGATPLFLGSGQGRVEVVRLLCDVGATKDQANNAGATPLFVASAALKW